MSSSENTKSKKSSATKEHILSVAKEVFLRKGYYDCSLREIATLADVNLGLLPYYFKSKEFLAQQICFSCIEDLYSNLACYDFSSLGCAEALYVSSFIVKSQITNSKDFSKFYNTLLEATNVIDDPSEPFILIVKKIIEVYNLNVSEEEMKMYLCATKGCEKMLITKQHAGEISISIFEICNIICKNLMFNLGVSPDDMQKALENAYHFLRRIGYKIP